MSRPASKVSTDRAVARARQYFDEDYNCAESVFKALVGEKSGLSSRVATGFGGGIAGQGSVCGAVTAAVMALGLKYGRVRPTQGREPSYRRIRSLCQRFKKKFGSLSCCDLLAAAKDDRRARVRASAASRSERPCARFIEEAIRLYFDLAR